ncbi:GntR family transcriptional regulator [Streptomyces pinistramenti]|uniref:GntR family transcriptional regulator n=1 Tax=Streptomyces pinistramenti TaxID=2884812 RepID=UPI001D099262|nr:GntR family transcriptional regulator [Streptomyces pinistramenti]MCB5906126.1 GntR family transcriptional regulator [Streptomyces pinistramenti]
MGEGHRGAQSAAQRAYVEIAERMAAGDLEPGAWLREESLAASIGISRTPVREALRRLASEGLVRFEANRGAQVVAWDRSKIAEIYGLRAAVEGYVAAVAAQNISDEALGRLEANLDEYIRVIADARPDARQHAAELNNEFHALVLASTANESLVSLLHGVLGLPLVRRTFLRYSERDLARSVEHHRELIEALRRRDAPLAEMMMKVHIRAAEHSVLEAQDLDRVNDDG